jgi:hypothetical protein
MGKLLLIFDGFDEMADRIDRQKMINNFWELARVVVPGSKVILTCRTEHFPEAKQGRAILSAELQASVGALTGAAPQFEVLELAQFDHEQVRSALLNRASAATVDRVLNNPELMDLARRPIMTELVLDALPEVEAGRSIDLSRVYLYAITRKMERDITAQRTFTSLADKMYFLCELSWEMLATDRMNINYRLFPDRLRTLFGDVVSNEKDLDHYQFDMMGQTILIRNDNGDCTPAHRSLIEFFASYKIVAQMGALLADFTDVSRQQSNILRGANSKAYTWSEYFHREVLPDGEVNRIAALEHFVREPFTELVLSAGKAHFSPAMLALMQGMVDVNSLYQLLSATCGQRQEVVGFAGGNAATLINRFNGSFESAKLESVSLEGAELTRSIFRNADLRNGRLRGVILSHANLEGANLSGVDLREAMVWQCSAKGASFAGVVLDDDSILVFTGDSVSVMPAGSTLLDAAYSIHSEVGGHFASGTVNGRPAQLDEVLPNGARVWVSVDRTRYTVSRARRSIVKTWQARRRIEKTLRQIGAVETELRLALQTSCRANPVANYNIKLLETGADYDLFDAMLSAILNTPPDTDERLYQYQDVLEGRRQKSEIVEALRSCLVRYAQLRYELVRVKAAAHPPRTLRRLWSVLVSVPLAEACGFSSTGLLFEGILRGEIMPEIVAREHVKLYENRKSR